MDWVVSRSFSLTSPPTPTPLQRRGGFLEEFRAVRDWVFGASEGDVALFVGETRDEAFGDERADLLGGKVGYGDDLGADELLGGVVVGDLGGRSFGADFGAEVDGEFVGGFSGFGEWFGVGDCADSEFDSFEMGVGDFGHLVD